MLLNISPATIPGVELTRGDYLLSGDIVATADLEENWEEVALADADWNSVQRSDNPVIEGGKVAYPRFYGVNATTPAACQATRALDATGQLTAATAAAADSAAHSADPGKATGAAGSISSSVWMLFAGAVAAVTAML